MTLEFLHIPKDGSDIHRFSQQEVGLNHVTFWKSVIRAILKYTGKIPTSFICNYQGHPYLLREMIKHSLDHLI